MSRKIVQKRSGEVRFSVPLMGTKWVSFPSLIAVKAAANRERGKRNANPYCVLKQSHTTGSFGGESRQFSRPAWPGLFGDF